MRIIKKFSIFYLLFMHLCWLSNALKIGKDHVKDPVPGYKYYYRWYDEEEPHYGVDIVGETAGKIKGADVYPVLKGKVIAAKDTDPKGEKKNFGKVVMIDHGTIEGKGYITLYAHLDSIEVNEGDEVDENTLIGKVGNTGNSSGYHLHYELREYDPEKPPQNYSEVCANASPVNPGDPIDEDYTKQPGAKGGGGGNGDDDSLTETERITGAPSGGAGGGAGGSGGGAGGAGSGTPGNDTPDDNLSFSSSFSLNSKDLRAVFYRLAGKKGKKYVLKHWEYLKLMDEREKYFESISNGGNPDESYLESLNQKIDELYESLQSGEFSRERSETPDVLILRNGFFFDSSTLEGKLLEPWRRVSSSFSPSLVKENPVMIIPTGGLYGMEISEQFKAVLRNYVENGGFLIVFAQQHGYEFSCLPTPDGKPITGYGWREDRSCHSKSVYTSSVHPSLSGLWQTTPSIVVDGYFESIPESSVVLLRRVKNGYPVAFFYPFGSGYVFVTSMYEDWASANWQSTEEGRRIIRDLISWAKRPVTLPTYNFSENPNPIVSLNVEIKNSSEKKAEKVKILWLDPYRNLVKEEEQTIFLNPNESTTLPLSIQLKDPLEIGKWVGIWHVDYILYNSSDEEIQPQTETDSGRFVITKNLIGSYNPSNYQIWFTSPTEEVFEGEEVVFTLHLKNNTSSEWNGTVNVSTVRGTPIRRTDNFSVPAGGEITIDYPLTVYTTTIIRADTKEVGFAFRHVNVSNPRCSGTFASSSKFYLRGEEERFILDLQNLIPYEWSGTAKLRISNVYETSKEFTLTSLGNTRIEFSYLPPASQPIGSYGAEVEIFYKDRKINSFKEYFTVDTSRVKLSPSFPAVYKDGQTNNISFKLQNLGSIRVNSGNLNIMFLSPNGEKIYEESKNFSLEIREEKEIGFSIPFPYLNSLGGYKIQYSYSDETGNMKGDLEAFVFEYYPAYLSFDKQSYLIGENAELRFSVGGGKVETDLEVEVSAPSIGFSEKRNFHYDPLKPLNPLEPTLIFTIPITLPQSSSIPLQIKIKVPSGGEAKKKETINVFPVDITLKSLLSTFSLKGGDILSINYEIEGKSGFISPIPAQLKVSIPGINYQSAQSLTINPAQTISLPISVSIPENAQSGSYQILASLELPNGKVIQKSDLFMIPYPSFSISVDKESLNAGEELKVKIENRGGVSSETSYKIEIKDKRGVSILSKNGSTLIDVGSFFEDTLTIPSQALSGSYTLSVFAEDGKTKVSQSFSKLLNITGISAELSVRTEKDSYFTFEDIKGFAESSNPLQDSKLRLEVLKTKISKGGAEVIGLSDMLNVNDIDAITSDSSGKFYFATSGGIFSYDGTSFNKILEKGVSTSYPDSFFSDSKGRVWFGGSIYNEGSGLWVYESGTWRKELSDVYIYSIIEDINGNIYFGTGNGVLKYDGTNYSSIPNCPFSSVDRVRADKDGKIWATGYPGGGIAVYDGTGWTHYKKENSSLPSNGIRAFEIDGNGLIYLLYYSELWTFDGQNSNKIEIPSGYDGFSDIEMSSQGKVIIKGYEAENWNEVLLGYDGSWNILGVFYDNLEEWIADFDSDINGNLWAGFWSGDTIGGIRKFDRAKWNFLYIPGSKGLIGEPKNVKRDSKGSIWIATSAGLQKFDGKDWESFLDDGRRKIGTIYAMNIDFSDRIWVATPLGVRSFDGVNWSEPIPYPNTTFDFYWISSIAVDKDGHIWLGTKDWRMYLSEYNGSEWVIRETLDPALGTRVYIIETDKKGNVWISFENLVRYNSGEIYWDIFPSNIYIDRDDNVWVGAWDGVWRFDGESWKHFDESDGYPSLISNILTVSEDSAGKKYFGARGWDEFDNPRYYILTFDGSSWTYKDITDGLPTYQIPDGGEVAHVTPEFICIDFYAGLWLFNDGGYEPEYAISIGGSALREIVFWSEEKPFSQNYEASIGKLSETGSFILRGTLFNPIGQKIAESLYPFSVFSEGISLSLGVSERFVRLNGTSELRGVVSNGGDTSVENLNLKVFKKIGESEEIIHDEIFSIPSKSTYQFSLNLPTGEKGEIIMRAEVLMNGSLIAQEETGYEVCEAKVDVDVSAPQYAGDEGFDIKVSLKNSGKIDSSINVKIQALSFEEDVSLKPNEERTILIPAQITQTTDYQIEFSGDYQEILTKRVEYGYSGSAELGLQPLYPKGEIVIPVKIRNTGRMDWSRDVQFELLSMQGIPVQTIDRTYTLSPQSDFSDNLSFILSPGEYTLRYSSTLFSGEGRIRVSDPGIGVLGIEQFQKYPEGKVSIPFTIENKDSFAGDFEINFVVKRGDEQIASSTQRYLIQPNEKIDDKAFFELSEGNYTLEIQGAKIGPISPVSLSILPYERVSWNVSQEPLEGGSFSLNIQIQNSGFSDFNGSVLISSNFFNMEDTIEIGSGENKTLNYSIPVDSASIGENPFTVSLIKSSGEELFKEERKVTVLGDDIQLTEIPSGLIFNAGESANIPFKIKNLGNKDGTVIFSYRTMDLEETEVNLTLKAGEEKEISVQFPIPDDLPDGDYSLYYRLEGKKEGEVRFKVQGIAIEVSANLDKPSYKEGETAHLTLNISKLREGTIEGFAKVNYLGYEEEKEFELSSSVSLTFDIPLPQITPEKVFYGIYHRDGRGIHLNSIYIYKEEDVKVLTDKQVYKAGENVSVSVTSTEAGVIKLSAPGYEEEFEISGTVSRTFTLPANLKAGTYGVSWEFRPSDTTKPLLSGTHLFDVDGLLVKVVEAMIDKGKYNPGEQIQLKLMLESNRDIQLTLRAWVLDPEGNYNLSGEGTVSLRKDEHTLVTSSYPLETSLAGIHRLIYALYDSSEELVVSGSESFDCGGAVVLGVRTEKPEYPVGNESVKVHLDLFGEGSAELKIFLENEEVKSENLSLSGIQTKEIELEPSVLKPGILTLKAEILKDNLKSSKETSFIYGSNLPDLTVQLQASGYEQATNPLTYKIKATIRNEGKSPSSATTVAFFEGDTLLEEKEVHALNPDEEIEVEINYDGRGKAGTREIIAEVDKANTVREFNENNNRVSIILEIPEILHELSLSKDEFSAFEDCTIITRIFNNRENALSGEIEIVVSNISSNQIVFERKENVSIAPFTEALISSVFNTGTYPEGEYRVSSKLTADSTQLLNEKIIRILRTERIEGNLTIQPKVISPNKDEILTATVELTNRGNVAITDGELKIEIKKKETGEKLDEKRIEFSIDVNESKTIQEEIRVNLHEGFYILTLLFNEEKLDDEEIECRFEIETVKKESLSLRVLVLDNTIPLLDEIKGFLKEIKDKNEREKIEAEWKLRISKEVEFVENALKSAGILYRIEKEWMAQAKELRKGVWNIIILLGSKTHSPFIEKEIRERVFRGDGLIVTLHYPWEEPFLREVLGVKTEGFLNLIQKEKKTIQTFPTPISSEGEFEITSRFVRIVPESQNLLIAGKIKNEGKPVIVLNKYGEGKAVTFAFPLSVNEQENENAYQVLKQILISSIFYLSPKKTSDSSISRLVPIELNLSNPTSKEMEIRVKEVLQQNVKVYLRYPQDEQDRQERQDELTWKIKLQPGSSQSILYIAELPDQIGSYEFKSEIYLIEGEKETKIDEKSLVFNVEKKVKDRIREIIVELEKLPVQTMKDRARVRVAINHLERIVGRNGESWLNLLDVLSAIDSVKEIESADPTSIRNSLINIMLFYERRVAESGFMWN